MERNKKKIIRAVTVSMSCVFFEEVMRRLRADGFEMVALTSPGPELDALKNGGITKKPMKVLGYGNVKGVDMERFNPDRFKSYENDKEMI